MTTPHRKLYAVKRKCNVDDDTFKAILLGQIGSESAKNITWAGVNACVKVMQSEYGSDDETQKEKDPDWREPAKSAHARKIYALWGILRRNDKVEARFPDGFVKRMTDRPRVEWLTPTECNTLIEALIDWIKREGLSRELK